MSAPTLPTSPYPGIRPFREDEEYLFFGRESQVDAMVDTLARGRFLAVIGSSGCGKSSLVNCGLRPALHRGLLTRAGSAWRMASCRPGGHPLRALAQALAAPGALYRKMDSGPFTLAEFIETTLTMSRRGLVEAWQQARLPEGTNLLVIVDQFEELFRYRQLAPADEDPATAFVNLLLQARAEDLPIHVVLTMRSDFLGDCARFAGLPEAINGGQYLVPRMSRDDRRAAILGPARVCGADIEPTLLTRLVNDVGDDPDQLSLLQHALARCWEHWRASGDPSPIEARHYDAVGTLAHALNQHAEEIFDTLAAPHRLRCAAVFRALTDTGTDPRGIRRPTRFATLDAITAGNAEAAAAPLADVLAPFRAPGAAFLMPPAGEALEADTVIDLAHESLMRIWDRLRDWGEREADAARMLRRLADAAELHAAGQASLWRDPELQFALDWRARNHPTEAWARQYGRALAPPLAFLDASREAHEEALAARAARIDAERRTEAERQRTRRRWHLALAGVTLTSLLAGVTLVLWRKAENESDIARAMANQAQLTSAIASARQLAAQSTVELANGNLSRALDLAAASYGQNPVLEARESLLAALAAAPADWLQTGQQGIHAIAVSPDGRLVATGGHDGSIRIAHPDGRQLARLRGHTDRVLDLAFSPDSQTLASAGLDGSVRRWDPTRAQPIGEPLQVSEGAMLAVAYSPDGRILASAGADRTLALHDAATGKRLHPPLAGHRDTVTHLAFSPDGRSIASVGYDGGLLLWDTASAKLRAGTTHGAILHHVAFSPDGRTLATAGADRRVSLWDSKTLAPIGDPQTDHGAAVRAVAFSQNGLDVAAAGDDHRLLLWTRARWQDAPRALAGHFAPINALVPAPDGSLWSGDGDGVLVRHAPRAHPPFAGLLPKVAGAAWALAWRPDGQQLARSRKDGTVEILDARSGEPVTPPLAGHDAIVPSLAWSPDGKTLASAGQDGRLLLWQPGRQAPAQALVPPGPPLRRASISPDGRHLAAAGQDGRTLASAGYDGRVRLWKVADGQPTDTPLPPLDAGAVHRLAWSPDADQLYLATRRHGLMRWTLADGKVGPVGDERTALLDLTLSPDGQTLASADRDGHVRLWDMTAGQTYRMPILHHAGPPLALAWAPDGQRLASAGWDRGIVVLRTSPTDWTDMACALVRRNPPGGASGCPSPATQP